MKADERQRQILVRARADGRVEVGSLAADLDVAEETVRRDLRGARRARGAPARARRRLPGRERGLREQHQAPLDLAGRGEAPDRRRGRGAAARRRDGLHRRGRHPAVRRRGDPPGQADDGGHLLPAPAGGARGGRERHRAAARRPAARPDAGHRRPLGAADAQPTWSSTSRSSAPTASPASTASPPPTRPWPRSRPRSSRLPAADLRRASTPSSAPAASAASPRSRTSSAGHRHRAAAGRGPPLSVLGPPVVRA